MAPPKQIDSWDTFWMSLAYLVSMKSKDPSTKVGCVITDTDKNLRSIGYNGPPRGIDDSNPKIYQRPLKYLYFEHAERNAVYNATRTNTPIKGGFLYVTFIPCSICASAILQLEMSRLIIHKQGQQAMEMARGSERWDESQGVAMDMLQEVVDKGQMEIDWYDGPIIHRTFATYNSKHFQFCAPENKPRFCGCQCDGGDEAKAWCDLCTTEYDDT